MIWDGRVVSVGYNYLPILVGNDLRAGPCDGSDQCKATCGKRAVHAEQQAILAGTRERIIGASLLHTLSSATIGVSLALSFYKSAGWRKLSALIGVILAVALHTLFNFFILESGSGSTFLVFLVIWLGIVALLFAVEQVKQPARDYC